MGSIIAIIAILMNEAVQVAASNGLQNNLVIYLMLRYHMASTKAADIVFNWKTGTVIVASLWALVSDSHIGRFPTVSIASCCSLLGMSLWWITAMIPAPAWVHCNPLNETCRSPSTTEMHLQVAESILLFASLPLISIGVGVRRPVGLGADQVQAIRDSSEPQRMRIIERFFTFYFAASFLAVIFAFTATGRMLDQYGWKVGLGIATFLIFFFVIIFFVCSPLYFKEKPQKGLSTRILQVIVATCWNRNLPFPDPDTSGCYLTGNDSNMIVPSDNLRFLNKACLIANPEQEVAPDGSATNPWRLCTIEQVQELKALLRVLPIWSTVIIMWINSSQLTFKLLQADSMDRKNSSKFEISQAAFPIFGVGTMLIWGILYDSAILPLASKIKGEPVRLSVKVRMGIGLSLSCAAMIVSAIIESVRQRKAIEN